MNMLDLQKLGTDIAARRRARGMTQEALAARAGVSRPTIARLERGRMRELGFNRIMRILAALGADLRITEANAGRPTLEDLQAERAAENRS